MGLFSSTQIEQINKTAEKVVQTMKPPVTENVTKTNSELRDMEMEVERYFHDSKAILIETPEQLEAYVDGAIASGSVVGIDTETTGLDKSKDYIVGASLYYEGANECYIPMKHKNYLFDQYLKNQISYQDVGRCLQKFVDAHTKMIFANAPFDIAFIYKDLGVDFIEDCYFDVILAWRVLKENELHNDLKSLYNKYCLKGKGDPKRFSDFFSPKLFPYCKPKIAALYAANDAKITVELYKFELRYLTIGDPKCTKHHLEKLSRLYWDVENPLIKVVSRMHRRGMYLDQNTAEVLKKEYRAILAKQEAELAAMVDQLIADCDPAVASKRPFATGKDLNVNSTIHMKYLVYDMMGVPSVNGKTGTGKEVLTDLNLPITNKILDIRSTLVLINTFVEKLPKSCTADGRIHADFKQIGAATGRMSCIEENQKVMCISREKKIKDIKPGDIVYACTDDLELVLKPVLSAQKTGDRECVEVTAVDTDTGKVYKVVCTPEHPIRLESGEWCHAEDLNKGDTLLSLSS